MGTEDRKRVVLMLQGGQSINIVTRMPYAEIRREINLHRAEVPGLDPNVITIEGVDGPDENLLEVRIDRSLVVGSVVGKFTPQPVAVNPNHQPRVHLP